MTLWSSVVPAKVGQDFRYECVARKPACVTLKPGQMHFFSLMMQPFLNKQPHVLLRLKQWWMRLESLKRLWLGTVWDIRRKEVVVGLNEKKNMRLFFPYLILRVALLCNNIYIYIFLIISVRNKTETSRQFLSQWSLGLSDIDRVYESFATSRHLTHTQCARCEAY